MEWEGVFVSIGPNPDHPYAWQQQATCRAAAGGHSSRQCKVAFLSRRADEENPHLRKFCFVSGAVRNTDKLDRII
jgi:hypothetical protein